MNIVNTIRQKIRQYQFFSNHPHYLVSSEYVTEKGEMVFIETNCQIMTPEIQRLKRRIPSALRERFFNVKIDLKINFEKFIVTLATKSSHSDFYQSTVLIDLNHDLTIKNINIDIQINSALDVFAKPVKGHLKRIVRKTIYDDYELILTKLIQK